jgi:hypothetical protein
MFDNYEFDDIPLNRDIYIVDDAYLNEYEKSMLRFFDGGEYEYIGYVSYFAARAIRANSLELSWYANVHDRFHELSIILPREQFVACVGSWQCDEKPRIFVKSGWLEDIYMRTYSVFALVDAADVKKAIENGQVDRSRLIRLRGAIDSLAEVHPDVSFISFGDSILLKSNWSVGYSKRGVLYTYHPELFIHLAREINKIYLEILGLSTYAVIAQGSNEFYDDPLLHISKTTNHISLNSLGIPFAQLVEIEATARKAIRAGAHPRSELYLDEQYYHSLRFRFGFNKHEMPSSQYQTKMMASPTKYFYLTIDDVVANLESNNEY